MLSGYEPDMTALPPDPEPAGDPDLTPGGSVRPGATPPDSGSTTRSTTHTEHESSRKMGPIVIGILVVVCVLIGGLVIASVIGRLT